jgi:hypothetical protein
VSFATLFGAVTSQAPIVSVSAVDDPRNGFHLPHHSTESLSTSGIAIT